MSRTTKTALRFTALYLENWRNFVQVEVELPRRVFLVGPNASGKSNLLDLLEGGSSLADAVMPQTSPGGAQQLILFGD